MLPLPFPFPHLPLLKLTELLACSFLSVKKWLLRKKHQIELARKRGWKGYWVCLKGTTLLFYPCDSREGRSVEAAPKHLIIVDGAIMQPIPEHPKRDYIFCLSTAFGDAYLFQAPCQVSIFITACACVLVMEGGCILGMRVMTRPRAMLALISSSQYPREVLQGGCESLALPRPKSPHRKMAAQICLHKDMQGYASWRVQRSRLRVRLCPSSLLIIASQAKPRKEWAEMYAIKKPQIQMHALEELSSAGIYEILQKIRVI